MFTLFRMFRVVRGCSGLFGMFGVVRFVRDLALVSLVSLVPLVSKIQETRETEETKETKVKSGIRGRALSALPLPSANNSPIPYMNTLFSNYFHFFDTPYDYFYYICMKLCNTMFGGVQIC